MIVFLVWFFCRPPSAVAGPFGPPQPITRGVKGLHTAIGYWFHEGILGGGAEYARRENQVYSELGYGVTDFWEVYGRVGLSGLAIADAFRSNNPATITTKQDFADRGGVFGIIGCKLYRPLSANIGMGAFVQGAYYFSGFDDDVSGVRAGVPFGGRVKIDKMWDANFGIALQALLPFGLKAFAGPFFSHAEAKILLVTPLPDVSFGSPSTISKSTLGATAGLEAALTRGFRLNLETQYNGRFSLGSAIIYAY